MTSPGSWTHWWISGLGDIGKIVDKNDDLVTVDLSPNDMTVTNAPRRGSWKFCQRGDVGKMAVTVKDTDFCSASHTQALTSMVLQSVFVRFEGE
jgi:hypothetical protein